MVSCSKQSSALKHFEKEDCKLGHANKIGELKTQLLSSPPPGSSALTIEDPVDCKLEKHPLFLAALHQMRKYTDALLQENKKLQNTIDHLIEEGIDIHQWDDEDIEEEEDELDIVKDLDLLAKSQKWSMTRTQCKTAYQTMKPMMLERLVSKKRVSQG